MTTSSPVPSTLRKGYGRAVRRWAAVLYLALVIAAVAAYRSLAGFQVLTVLSGSMRPACLPGSLVITRWLPGDRYHPGDVVSFRTGAKHTLVTHRVTAIASVGDGRYVASTKGDANTNGDSWGVPTEQIVGKVVATVPWVGYLVYGVRIPLGFTFLAILSFATVVLPELMWMCCLIRTRPIRGATV